MTIKTTKVHAVQPTNHTRVCTCVDTLPASSRQPFRTALGVAFTGHPLLATGYYQPRAQLKFTSLSVLEGVVLVRYPPTHSKIVCVVGQAIFPEAGSQLQSEFVAQRYRIELSVHVQYQVHLKAFTLTE